MSRLRKRFHHGGLSEYAKADIALLVTAGVVLAVVIGLGWWLRT